MARHALMARAELPISGYFLTGERVQRRLAAVLAADVAGYSRLMGLNEESTLAQLKAIRKSLLDPTIAEHRGRIVKTTGDGMLVEFASAVDAARCAAEIQRGMAGLNTDVPQDVRIEFRIGIHVGDIIIDDNDIFGDGVNIAARLEGIADPGGICISDDAQRQIRGKVDMILDDIGPQILKNIAEPMRSWRCRIDVDTPSIAPRSPVAAVPSLPLPDNLSIAVLPFQNMSGDPEQEYFADGIAEDIITDLSRYPDLFVVARNSSFTYRGKAVRIADVARELGVHYVLEGSVRRAGNRVRINAQLIDGASGKHLWAERYDRDLEDLFSVQDEVTQHIVGVLPARIESAAIENVTRKTASSFDAHDHLLRGKYCHHLDTPDANREADLHFDRAIEMDPRFASAYAWKACTLGQAMNREYQPRTPEGRQRALEIVQRAMKIDENDTECHRIMCRLALMEGQFAKSEHHLERALALNPNDPRLVVQRGINLTVLGDAQAAIPWIERAMRLDPFSAHYYYLDMVRALFMAERPAEAIVVLEKTARADWAHYLWLAACCAAADKDMAAQQAARQAVALRPHLSITTYGGGLFVWKRDEDRKRLCDALARAGLPP
ncbi:MAG TPA: adenylate/guanylate cyclase domain-containing protein [Bradyrhizobium sp.]|nr:adenylate/guanylate cyclase domain-containing protein [Bradyrhizobium sp.]